MAEGTHRPGGEPPKSEQDLLADRRARRASEAGEGSLVRRAEVAEATVQTLETHLASLQQRVREAEEESRRTADLIEGERSMLAAEPRQEGSGDVVMEYELRRARQRSHVERQLRIEAEDRYVDLERESRAEIDRLLRRLSSSEREVQELAGRFDVLQQELTEARQAAAGRGAAEQRAESELHLRLAELEQSAAEIQRGLESERDARMRSEQLLESMSRSHRQMQAIVGDLRSGLARLNAALSQPTAPVAVSAPESAQAPGGAMADALAAAVVRLRDRAEEAHAEPGGELGATEEEEQDEGELPAFERARAEALADGSAAEDDLAEESLAEGAAAEREQEGPGGYDAPQQQHAEPAHVAELRTAGLGSPRYKHSLSLIGRLRLARKQRRARS